MSTIYTAGVYALARVYTDNFKNTPGAYLVKVGQAVDLQKRMQDYDSYGWFDAKFKTWQYNRFQDFVGGQSWRAETIRDLRIDLGDLERRLQKLASRKSIYRFKRKSDWFVFPSIDCVDWLINCTHEDVLRA